MNSPENINHELLSRLVDLERQVATLRGELCALPVPHSTPSVAFQALVVAVGADVYGIPIAAVREILRYVELTQIAEAPRAVAGAINVRGQVFPVVDARLRFDHEAREPRLGTAIILTQHGTQVTGLIVDHVLEVIEITPLALAPAPGALILGGAIATVATVGDRILQLIEVERVLQGCHRQLVNESAAQVSPAAAPEGGGL